MLNLKNITFIGMPAVGKSTIGVVVAKRLGYDFIDTDLLIQKREKRLLCEIIEEEGVDRFIEIEEEVNCSVDTDRAVIAPGGSAVYSEKAMNHFKGIGTVVYLYTSYETIEERIGDPVKRGVTLRAGQTLKDLYNERTALFEKYADVTVSEDDCDLTETITKVINALTDK